MKISRVDVVTVKSHPPGENTGNTGEYRREYRSSCADVHSHSIVAPSRRPINTLWIIVDACPEFNSVRNVSSVDDERSTVN